MSWFGLYIWKWQYIFLKINFLAYNDILFKTTQNSLTHYFKIIIRPIKYLPLLFLACDEQHSTTACISEDLFTRP